MSARRYCLITPCRDEAQYAGRTIESVAAQTVRPALWVIVDDGSQDGTPALLEKYAAKYDFIRIVRRRDRGFRKLGGGVIDAFYEGYQTVDPREFDFVCKLDLDLDLPPRYFETLMDRMAEEPRLGTCSGKPFFLRNGKRVMEMCGDENSVGMTKFYRVRCFQDIGGFVRELMWDGIDCHRCRMNGWIAASFNEPDLLFEHLRPMGTSDKGWWTGRARHGAGQYFMGTHVCYILGSSFLRMFQPPVLVGGIAMLWGYFRAMLGRKPRYQDPEFRTFLRKYQWSCLCRGKATATRRINERQKHFWTPPPSAQSGAAASFLGLGNRAPENPAVPT